MADQLRIGLIEDNDRLRADFARVIDEAGDMTCVAAFATAEDALNGLRSTVADVLLVDSNLPGISGIDFVRRMRAAGAATQIVMLTTFDDANTVFESLKARANGYVLKPAALVDLRAAFRDLRAGGPPVPG